ncbi:hypothetical protein EAG18_06955 [Pseudoalteromonas sp. J010]|nr:hypothetical protein EAG18_06955 [Pseudoalteromonas sp. J010]
MFLAIGWRRIKQWTFKRNKDTGLDAFIRKMRTLSDTMEEERFRTLNYSTLQDAVRRFRKRGSAMGRALLILLPL